MKKFFTLFASAVLAAGSMMAQEVIATVDCPASKNNPEGTEDLGYYFKKGWSTKPFDLDFKVDGEVKGMDGKYFENASVGDILRFYYTIDKELATEDSPAQIQLAAKIGEDWTWTQMFDSVILPDAPYWDYTIGESQTTYVDYRDENDDVFNSAEEELEGLKQSGIVVKGQLFWLKKIELISEGEPGAGIGNISADSDKAAEIYTTTGIRVNNMTPGQIYIVRQGSQVSKIIR